MPAPEIEIGGANAPLDEPSPSPRRGGGGRGARPSSAPAVEEPAPEPSAPAEPSAPTEPPRRSGLPTGPYAGLSDDGRRLLLELVVRRFAHATGVVAAPQLVGDALKVVTHLEKHRLI